jgi:maleylacetate reductase
VVEAADAARAAKADLIVTFGGGSLTDAGKLMQIALKHGVKDVDGFDAFRAVIGEDGTRKVPSFAAPDVRQIAIPTTLSAAEFNTSAGATDTRKHVKHSFRHPLLVPRVVILDPAPTVHTPLWLWLSTGVRALDHIVEGMCSGRSNPVSDASYLQGLKLLTSALPRVKANPGDLEARLDCQLAAWLSMAARQAQIPMGASHAIGHVLGGTCGVAHGHTSCVMLPSVLRYNLSVNADRQRLVAEAMGQPGKPAADVVAGFIASLGLPGSLKDVGVEPARFREIAEHAMHDEWLHMNPRKITSPEQVLEILEAAA